MGYFSDRFMEILPQVYSVLGTRRIRNAKAASGNKGDDTLVVSGIYLGAVNDTYTVTVTTGGAPPAARITVTSRHDETYAPYSVPMFGSNVRITPLGLSVRFKDGGDGVLTEGDAWTIEVTAGDLHDFRAIQATGFDTVEKLISGLGKLVDIDDVPDEYLPYLGALIDYDYDRTRSAEKQRQEIKDLMQVYRLRGTKPGMLRKLRLAGYPAAIFEPFTKTIKLNTVGRGLGSACKLTGAMYSHCTFEVRMQELCRRLRTILLDEIPRGTRMFSSQTFDLATEMPFGNEMYVTGDSDFSLGTGRYPFRLWEGDLQLVLT